MSAASTYASPALHNAMWPGLVGKGPDSEPPIDLETMLNLTAAAEVDGVRFDGVDLFLSLPHTDIDSTDDDLKRLAEHFPAHEIAEILDRPVGGVAFKVYQLKLSLRPRGSLDLDPGPSGFDWQEPKA